MDEANQKAMDVWATQGESAMLKHIMTSEDGTPIVYAEMSYVVWLNLKRQNLKDKI